MSNVYLFRYEPTMGMDFKNLEFSAKNKFYNLEIWDTVNN